MKINRTHSIVAALLLCGCAARPAAPASAPAPQPSAPTPPASAPAVPATPSLAQAPWRGSLLAASATPPVFLAQWRRAENRAACAPLAPASLGAQAGAAPRAASFGGGWGVAYDLPGMRSAFGIAGTGSLAADPSYSEWPYRRAWADGSTAGYGPEGGTGPNQLAYLRVAGQACLYNVWSALGREHLESLLEQLRFVSAG